jgi:hypothetical protein
MLPLSPRVYLPAQRHHRSSGKSTTPRKLSLVFPTSTPNHAFCLSLASDDAGRSPIEIHNQPGVASALDSISALPSLWQVEMQTNAETGYPRALLKQGELHHMREYGFGRNTVAEVVLAFS